MEARWSPFFKQLVIVASLAATFWLLLRLHDLLIPIIFALLLAYVVSFPVGWIVRRTGWPRPSVVAAFYLLVVLILITAPVILMPRLFSLLTAFAGTLRNVILELSATNPRPIKLSPTWSIDLGPFYAPINQWLRSVGQTESSGPINWQNLFSPFASSAVVVVRSAVNSVIWAVLVLTISFWIAKDTPQIRRFMASRIPEKLQPEVLRLWRELSLIWDAFVRGQMLLGVTIGLIVWLMDSILGVSNAAALGLLSGILEFVPGVGPPIGAAVGVLIALVLGSTWLPVPNLWFGVIVALGYFLVAQFEGLYLVPRIIGRRISLHPVVVVIGALVGWQLGGVLGILLAAPTVASLRVLFAYTAHKLLDEDPFPPQPEVQEQELYWRGLLRDRPVAAVLFDLDGTLVLPDSGAVIRLAGRLAPLRRAFPQLQPELVARSLLVMADSLLNSVEILLIELRLDYLRFRYSNRFRELRGYRAVSDFLSVPGSLEALHALAQRYPLALITNRSSYEVAPYLARYNLGQLFQAVITRDDARLLRPRPAPVRLAARRLGVKTEYCVVVGDTTADLRAAHANEALMVGVLSGFSRARDLQAADLVIDSVAILPRYLLQSPPPSEAKWLDVAQPARVADSAG